jgi:hypothetical protein
MVPGIVNLDIYQGDTKRWQFKLWADAARTKPADLTGVTVEAYMRDKISGGVYELEMECSVIQPNIINMLLTASQSRVCPPICIWDLQLTYPNGDIFTVLRGTGIVTQDVTRPYDEYKR